MEALAPERRLAGRYVLEQPIAAGGMAVVWRARDEVLARTVAVKCLRDELARDGDFAQRFQREAVAAARLTHHNIISVFDTGVEAGLYYIVMEYSDGPTLRELLEKQPAMDPSRAVALMIPVLTALGVAHREGLIHRDVKPANILVPPHGRVKVTDFGIAKAVFAGTDLTTTGQLLGTVRYLAPEQVQDSPVDARADLYSAGVVLYEMVTGRPPFVAQNDVATALMRLTTEPLPPRAIRGGIPRALELAILRAMARRPEDRFQSAEAMQGALQRLAGPEEATPPRGLVSGPPSAPPEPSSMFRSWMLVPLLVVVLAGAAIAGGLAFGRLRLGGPLGVRPAPEASKSPNAEIATLAVTAAKDFDPQGDDQSEDPAEVPLAIDGNPGTAWATQHYNSDAFGNLKDGVGLWIDLGRIARVSRVTISSPISGWSFELKAGTIPNGLSAPLADRGGATTFQMENGSQTIQLAPVRTRGLLIWITRLAPDDGRFAASVAEVTVAGQQ